LTGTGNDSGRPPHQTAAAAPSEGGLVVVRDERGVLSVMHCLPDELVFDPGFQQAYRAECAALAALGEPRLAEPLSYIKDASGRIVATVRRHFPGVALSELLIRARGGNALDAQAAATVASDVLVALDALHRRGVAHRRLDPSQIIVSRGGECVVVGAGLAVRPHTDGSAADDLGAAMAFDLAAVPELFALCVASGRTSGRNSAAAQYGAEKLHGVAQNIYTALAESRHASVDRWERGGVAAEMLAELENAAEAFGAGWRERGHERLALCARTLRRPRSGRSGRGARDARRRPTALISRSTSPRHEEQEPVTDLATAATRSGGIPREAWGVLPKGNGKRAIRRGGPNRWLWVAAIGIPLLVLLLAIALISGTFSGSAPKTPPPPSLAVETGGQAAGGGATPGPATSAAASPSPSSSPSAAAIQVAAASPTPPTGITSLAISSLAFTAMPSGTATVVVDAHTSGTATVNVAVTINETGPYGPNSRTDHFTFSGQRQYTLSDNFRAMPCSWGNAKQVVATVQVTATVPSTGAAPATASGSLYSVTCGG
jgi:serine/threonine-protein kinase